MDAKKKEGRYNRLYQQIDELLKKSPDQQAMMATVSAILYNKMDYFFWCGFYRKDGNRLIVGPYQGPAACQILEGRGVCLAAVEQQRVIVVDDVHSFPGHIACDSRSLSEIVIPVKNIAGEITGVLDVDSKELASFDDIDALYLQKIVDLLQL
ncbi:MAG: GAF domain-containing protein [Lentimicrobiaceae bacterium]|nr:GAF domain-containing protein [Lentimicrobiaceae bacterium]MCO5265081.1 GAF domain-containing protein [Lentimicrobium sp.]